MPLSTMLLHVALGAITLMSSINLKPMLAQTTAPSVCTTYDGSNPLHHMFPNNATGVLNTTLAILPISLSFARTVIPAQYAILEEAYRLLMPDFPSDMYPVLVQAGHDHDIRFQEYTINDFSRSGFEFPFIDLLHDGHSSFRWVPEQLIEASNKDAISGSEAYGTIVHASKFGPECDAYAALPNGKTYFNGSSVGGGSYRYMSLEFSPAEAASFPYPISLFQNITNQPIFAAAGTTTCDNMIRLFNTPMSTGQFEPIPVRGTVYSNMGPFPSAMNTGGIYGVQVATPFVENNFLECNTFKGYTDESEAILL